MLQQLIELAYRGFMCSIRVSSTARLVLILKLQTPVSEVVVATRDVRRRIRSDRTAMPGTRKMRDLLNVHLVTCTKKG